MLLCFVVVTTVLQFFECVLILVSDEPCDISRLLKYLSYAVDEYKQSSYFKYGFYIFFW
jgi:hypothetical protein